MAPSRFAVAFVSVASFGVVAGLAAMQPAAERADRPGTIVDVAAAGGFKTLLAAAQAAGLAETLAGPGPFTVFAPTDKAFAELGSKTVADLLKPENKARLRAILLYHVVPGTVGGAEALTLSAADTAGGQRLRIAVRDGQLSVDKARVIATDVLASNGVVHAIDGVLLPVEKTIPEVAKGLHGFRTLLAAAGAADLAGPLSGEGPFTLLAPTDDAFAKLPPGTVETLLKPENKAQLAAILKLHVIPGRVFRDQALKAGSAGTLSGETVRFGLDAGRAVVNGARLLQTDVDASNGVIHAIDAVLLPASSAPAPAAAATDAMATIDPRAVIALAIDRGVPLFNAGNPGACAAVYEVAAAGLLANPTLPEPARAPLLAALGAEGTPAERAWSLRRGLDAALAALPESATPAARPAAPAGPRMLPAMESRDLNGRVLSFPKDLPGERTLLLVAYWREQQQNIDTWVDGMELKTAPVPWFELPVVGPMNAARQAMLDTGMRMGIRGEDARARVVTLYTDRDALNEAMGLPGTREVHAVVVDKSGRVIAVESGDFTPEKAATITAALKG